jgi:hypothetical protein
LFNPATVHRGVDIGVIFHAAPTIACFQGTPRPPAIEIPVAIRFVRDEAEVFSPDPSFKSEPIRRQAAFVPESCGGPATFSIQLGNTGPLGPGFTVFRYAFDRTLEVPKTREDLFLSERRVQRDVFRWPRVQVVLEGHVFPHSVDLPRSAP